MKAMKIDVLPFNQENIDKYKTLKMTVPWRRNDSDGDVNMLRHARYKKDVTDGIILVNTNNDSLIGYVSWEGTKITSLEVSKSYQRLGYGKYLMDKAVGAGCTWLTVHKDNHKAIGFYLKYGFYFNGTRYGNNLKMKINNE